MGKKIIWLCLFCLAYASAFAQVQIEAATDKNTLTLDDELTLTVQVTGVRGNVVMPQLPSLPAFNVYSREVEQNSVNGNTTLHFRYIMLPRFVGKTTIGPVRFNYNGQTYQTEPISVQIYRNSTPATVPSKTKQQAVAQQLDPNLPPLEASLTKQALAKGTEPFFLVAAVSDMTPYVNESFTLAVRFYFSKSFYDAPYQKPTVSNLFLEDQAPREGSQAIGNTLYRYQEQRYQLTAASPGKATIGPASVRYKTGSSPFSAFDRLFGGAAVGPEKTALSAPITLNVRALPAGQPDSFYGAVGSGYAFSAQAQPQEVQAGEAINLTATVTGPGNLKSTQNLQFPTLPGFKIYPAAATATSTPTSNGGLRSQKTFKAVLVPNASGIYTLPALKWSYFNPKTASYQTLQTNPIQVTVTPAQQADSGFNFAHSQPVGTGFQALGSDIDYLKTHLSPPPTWLARMSQWHLVNWLCLLLVCACGLFTTLARKPLEQKKAFSIVKHKLHKAASHQEVADALSHYLQRKLHIYTGSMPLKEILLSLQKKGVTPATAQAFGLLWQQLEAARFAPAQATAQSAINLPAQALDVVKLIEEETR